MGLITNIRKHGGILITLIGLAVAGFIVMDVVQNKNTAGMDTTIGRLNGKTLEYNELRNMTDIMYQGSDAEEFQKNDYVWNYFIENTLASQVSEETGLAVSKPELIDMQFGNNISPILVQRFSNPQTGQVNIQQLNQIRTAIKENKLPPELAAYWSIQEKEIIKDRILTKYGNMIAKAMYVPIWQAKMQTDQQLDATSALAVRVPYTTIPDSDIKLTDADYEKYMSERKGAFINPSNTRSLAYMIIDAAPTTADTLAAKERLAAKIEAFQKTENDSLYAVTNEGSIDPKYVRKNTLNILIQKDIEKFGKGHVFGPYQELNVFKLAKIVDFKNIPDSVRSRHILLASQTADGMTRADQQIDSLKAEIESGKTKFEDAAKAMSMDKGSAERGGDLGYVAQGQMVPTFDKAIFVDLGSGQMKKVRTQYGVHLVQVLDRKSKEPSNGYNIAYITEKIVPSESTQQAALDKAEKILKGLSSVQDLEKKYKGSEDPKLEKPVQLEDSGNNIPGIGQNQAARDVVKWLFNDKTKVDELSKNLFTVQNKGDYFASKYIIAGLKAILPKGPFKLDQVREQIKPAVIAMKKGELMLTKFKPANDINAIAAEYNVRLDTLTGVASGITLISKYGEEPKFVAALTSADLNKMTKPVAGNSGVMIGIPFYRGIDNKQVPTPEQARNFLNSMGRNQVKENVIFALKKNADIKDNRINFF